MPEVWQPSFILYFTGPFQSKVAVFCAEMADCIYETHLISSPKGSSTTILSFSPECAIWMGSEFFKASVIAFCLLFPPQFLIPFTFYYKEQEDNIQVHHLQALFSFQ